MKYIEYEISSTEESNDPGGPPIWRVRDKDELAVLKGVAELFHAEIIEKHAKKRSSDCAIDRPINWNSEVVVYFNEMIRCHAETYAKLTSRELRRVQPEGFAKAGATIIVALWDDLSLDVLETIHAASLTRPIGVIVAEDAAELRRRVLKHTAAAYLTPPNVPSFRFAVGSQPHRFKSTVSTMLPVAAAIHVGHSDGLDLNVSRDEVMCAITKDVGKSASWCPPCVRESWCYRLQRNLDDALSDERLLRPEEIKARAAIFLTCFGSPANDSIVDAKWSLLEGLLKTSTIGCIATTIGIAIPSSDMVEALHKSLLSGDIIGDVLFRNPGFTQEAQNRCRLILFGDPHTRPLNSPREHTPAPKPNPLVVTQISDPVSPGQSHWQSADRLCLLSKIVEYGSQTHSQVRERFAAETGSGRNPLCTDHGAARHLEGLAPLWDHWIPSSPLPKRLKIADTCLSCGRQGDVFHYEFETAAITRQLKVCIQCGIYADHENGSALAQHPPLTANGTLTIPETVSDAWALVRLKDDLKRSIRWTLEPRKRRILKFGERLPQPVLTSGLSTLNVIYIRNLEVTSFQFVLGAKPKGSTSDGSVAAEQ